MSPRTRNYRSRAADLPLAQTQSEAAPLMLPPAQAPSAATVFDHKNKARANVIVQPRRRRRLELMVGPRRYAYDATSQQLPRQPQPQVLPRKSQHKSNLPPAE